MTDARTHDLLLFRVQQQPFALPAASVLEAVAPRAVTPLPFVPDHVEGLVNVGERVIPQLDVRRLLFAADALPAAASDELLVIDTPRAACALRVDCVTGRVALAADALQDIAATEAENSTDTLFAGQFDHAGETVLLIDAARLGATLVPREVPAGRRGMLGAADQREERHADELTCVVVRIGEESYAIPLGDTLELLDLGPARAIPGTPGVIEGIALVRDDVLLVLSLSRLLGRGENRDGARHVLVIERDGTRYGLRVDGVDGIVAFDRQALRAIDDETGEVAGVLMHEGGLYGLLTPRRLLPDPRHAALLPFVPESRREQVVAVETCAVLQVALGDEFYALPLEHVRRIAGYTPPERIDHEPGALVSGAVNIEGRIVPVVDLASHLQAGEAHNGAWVIVANPRGEWAIPVSEAHEIIEIPLDALEKVDRRDNGFVSAVATVGNRLVSLVSLAPLAGAALPEARA
jgi:purine-binding chemotaxis protein CheW